MKFKSAAEARAAKAKALASGRSIATAAEAEGRKMTHGERARVTELIEEAKDADLAAKTLDGDQVLRDELNGIHRAGGSGRASHNFGWAKAYRSSGYKDAITVSGTITAPSISTGIAPSRTAR